MSNTGLFHDTAPQLPAAGKTVAVRADTAAACFVEQERPTTPDEMKRFRKTFTGQPGKRIQHWGLEQDAAPRPGEFVFGVKGEKGQGVGDLLGGHLEPTSMQGVCVCVCVCVRACVSYPVDERYVFFAPYPVATR